jgi:hypothetical protein
MKSQFGGVFSFALVPSPLRERIIPDSSSAGFVNQVLGSFPRPRVCDPEGEG